MWSLVYDGFDPEQEGLREALCTLGNGYFATRGAAAESEDDGVHYPGTYGAGIYNRLETEIAGRIVENEDLVNLPNWLPLTFRCDDGEWFAVKKVELLSYRQELDLLRGVLLRSIRFRDAHDRITRVESERFVHMRHMHLAGLRTRICPENWSGHVEIRSALDGRVRNNGVARYRALADRHLEVLSADVVDDETIALKAQTNQSHVQIAQAARTRVWEGGELIAADRTVERAQGYVAQICLAAVNPERPVTGEKLVALHTSRDTASSECGHEARKSLRRAGDFDRLLGEHMEAWAHVWRRFDLGLDVENAEAAQVPGLVLRLHVFHLLQTASPHTMDLDVGVPARGLHGEAYRGHIFWDELFIFPMLNLRMPEITRSLLRYRYRRLGEARAAAAEIGAQGALYPWQSGSNGREESQRLHLNPRSGKWIPDHSRLQYHVNSAIAYNVWQYYQVTRDIEFIAFYGAEMLFEIARFWASVATFNEDRDRYEIVGVMGPDEYHDAYPDSDAPGLDNNAYTNLMAVWVICRALELIELLPNDGCDVLRERLGITDDEIRRWDHISRRMTVPFHDDGIISQFEGYGDLAELDWDAYRRKYRDIHRLDRILDAEGDSANRYKLSKQADVLMLFYLFSADELRDIFRRLDYPFAHETIPKNVSYYLQRTAHGSTLSRVVHAWVVSRSDRFASWELFLEALQSDIADIQGGTTSEGIHLGAMAGTVDLVQRAYTGIETRGDVLWFNPALPSHMRRLDLNVCYRGHPLTINLSQDYLRISTARCTGGAIEIGFREQVFTVNAHEVREFAL